MNDNDPDATMKLPDPGTPPSAGELLARALNTPGPSIGDGRWTPPAPEELAALLPQYEIESLLGHGGMGAVYKGRQAALDRPVAIKLLPAEMAADAQFIARFKREAQTLAKLQHPGIVTVYDFGQTSEGHLYFVMEFVDGTDLHRILHAPGGLNPAQALELISQICDALHYAHGKGVIHRDIKPGNILVTTDSRAKLADFGLARPIKEESTMLTGTNVVMGTAAYMAPEQQEGRSDQRADIYALGVMLYEMLCGQRPSGAFDPPSHRVQVDVRLDDVVIKAMQQQPERRYQQVSEMKTDVDRIRTTPEQRKPAPKPKSKSPATAAIIAACLIVALYGAARLSLFSGNEQHTAEGGATATPEKSSPALQRVEPSAASGRPDGLKPPTTLPATLDLIDLVDVQRDRLRAEGNAGVNQWAKSGGQLAFVSADKRGGKMGAPVALNGLRDYEVEVGVPNTPEAAIVLDFPISATNQATIAFVPGKEVMVRDESGKLKAIGAWPKEAAGPPWKLAGRVSLGTDGMNGTLSAAVNGLPVGEWRGALGKLGRPTEAHPEFPGQLVPALYVPAGDRTHSSWTLRVFDGEAKVLRGTIATVSPSPSPQVSQSPASATKDAPFVNTLGMKFVPVPITGGPTGGQRVLFSVWETRVQDYQVFAKETRHKAPKPEFPQGPTHPVVGMSWDDAQAFCKWLTERERKSGQVAANESYRLPTDHEWSCAVGIRDREDAAQLPEAKNQKNADAFPWGTVWPPPRGAGNYSGEEVTGQETWEGQKIMRGYRDDFPATAPVGTFAADSLGLFDLGGNVREWCEEWSDAKQEGRVMRGASFDTAASAFLRSSFRSSVPPVSRLHRSGGFRVVLAPVVAVPAK